MTPAEHWALWEADPRATPFQSPAWIDPWWQVFGGPERLDIEVRDGDRLVAALPAQVWHDGDTRRLIPVAAGQSDYSDALIDPAVPDAAARLWHAIGATADRWDEVLLPDLRPGSPLLRPPPPGWTVADAPGEVCPVLTLPDGPLLPSLSKSQRRKVVHDRHRAVAAGGVEEGLATPEQVPALLDDLFALHAARWQALGEPGVLGDARMQGFLRLAARELADRGLLRIAYANFRVRNVAVLFALADRSRTHSYALGTAADVPGQSFGSMAFATLIEHAAASGDAEFHFLRGEESYKYQWGALPTATVRRTAKGPIRDESCFPRDG